MAKRFGKTPDSFARSGRLASGSMSQAMTPKTGAVRWRLKDTEVLLDPSGAMYVPSASLLVVSDLHFEKGSHYAASGQFLPPYDTRATLKAVEAAIATYRPNNVLSLGDTFHDVSAERRMAAEDYRMLQSMCDTCDWIFVLGNHDPLPPKAFRGEAVEEIMAAGLNFTHEPEGEGWNVAGHLHPCAVATREGRRLRRSCFVSDGTRMILPSMGAFTGGLNVLDEAFRGVFANRPAVFLRSRDHIYRVSPASLRPDNQPSYVPRLRKQTA